MPEYVVTKEQFDAMVDMLNLYESGIPLPEKYHYGKIGVKRCPFCATADYCTNEEGRGAYSEETTCVWWIFEGMTCCKWEDEHDADLCNVRESPETYPEMAAIRAKMIREWIIKCTVKE